MTNTISHLDGVKRELKSRLKTIFILVPIASCIMAGVNYIHGLHDIAMVVFFVPLATAVTCLIFLQKNRVTAATFTLSVVMTVLATYRCLVGEGIHEISIAVYPMIILFSSFLFDKRLLMIIALMIVMGMAMILFGEVYGYYEPTKSTFNPYFDILILGIFLSINVLVLYSFSNITRKALKRSLDEINNQKDLQTGIKTSLSEKNRLLGEIHHRVKNNLTFIYSIIGIEMTMHKDNKDFQDIQESIQTIAKVYDPLFQSHHYQMVNIKDYLNGILSNFIQSHKLKESTVKVHSNELSLKNELVIPIGIVFIELLKSSAPNNSPLEIYIFQQQETLLLSVIALEKTINKEEVASNLLIKSVSKINGKIGLIPNGIEIEIPLQHEMVSTPAY